MQQAGALSQKKKRKKEMLRKLTRANNSRSFRERLVLRKLSHDLHPDFYVSNSLRVDDVYKDWEATRPEGELVWVDDDAVVLQLLLQRS